MYDIALFAHVMGVVLLVSSVMFSLTGVLRAHRAATVGQLRTAVSGSAVADGLIPPAMLLVWGAGLYLLSRHGDDGHIRWTSPWIVASLAIVLVMSALGPAVEGRRVARLHKAAEETPDGPVTAELDALRRDPALVHVLLFGSCQIVVLLFLMTNKPGLGTTLAVVIGAALLSVVLARLALSRVLPLVGVAHTAAEAQRAEGASL